ncbi:tyrosine-type recombinase/integrase [Devosia sp. BSSL-BM10]|uniref:Tyrosine-type recombinase/integrase n=1 Tax=Devosia litorisediminis TaxID=2829817 RepID=A0A942IES1_9HYPH|nr:site-specific integrase [Devosia litorisediminis]MBS3849715.1 tyrosine-type recombinase/integrase [Devosia litorisediminis]
MPTAKLTRKAVEELQPQAKPYTVWDSELPGFGVVVNPGGRIAFVVDYVAAGRRRRMVIGRFPILTVDQARAQARTESAKAQLGADPLQDKREAKARRDGLTVADLCDQYLEAADAGKVLKRRSKTPKKASTLATDRGRVERHIKPLLGKVLVADLTQRQVQQFVDDVTAGKTATKEASGNLRGVARVTGGAGTAARTVGLLGGILSWGIRQGALTSNPALGVERAADKKRDRHLSPDEFRALGKALQQAETEAWQAVAGIHLLAFTGCRLGEIVRLKWSEIDLEGQVLILGDSKTGKSVRPLGAPAQRVLARLQRTEGSEYVLTGVRDAKRPYGSLDTAIDRITKAAGLTGVTAHVLRHSFASVAGDLNYSDGTIGTMVGHQGHSVTSRYTHRLDAVLIAAATKVASEIERMMTGREAVVVAMPKRA